MSENMHSYVGYWKFVCYLNSLPSIKQNMQCAYNVNMWRVRVTLNIVSYPKSLTMTLRSRGNLLLLAEIEP